MKEAEPRAQLRPPRDVSDEDWDGIAALMNVYESYGVTGDILRTRDSLWGAEDSRWIQVVEDDRGRIVAYGRAARRQSEPTGKFRTGVYVHPDHGSGGLGREMLSRAEAFALANGATALLAAVEADCSRGKTFAEAAGYRVEQYLFESRLDLLEFDSSRFEERRSSLEEQGFTFTTLELEGDSEASWRNLFELDCETDQDTPGSENWSLGTFDEYVKSRRTSHGFTLAGVRVAKFDGRWAGVNAVAPTTNPGEMWTDYTGVRAEHRGKGVALALKVEGIKHAQELGMRVMVTNNDDRNAPMLAVNRALGFVESPGFFIYKKTL